MLLAQCAFPNIVQLQQWLSVISDIAAVGLLEVKPDGLVIRASNAHTTSFIEWSIDCSIYFHYVRSFYVNVQFSDFLKLTNEWLQKGLNGAEMIFTNNRIILQHPNHEDSIFVTLSKDPFALDAKTFFAMEHLAVEFSLTELQSIIRELSIVGKFVDIETMANRELKLSTVGDLGEISFETKCGKCRVLQDDLSPYRSLGLHISLCDLKTITLLNTLNSGILRFIPNTALLFEAGGTTETRMTICIVSQ